MSPRQHLLDVLGLGANATLDEIKKRYRQLARRYHPDLNPGDERANARFTAIRRAYEALLAGTGTQPEDVDEVVLLTKRKQSRAEGTEANSAGTHTAPPSISASPVVETDRVAGMIAERRAKLAKSKRELQRLQADVRDGEGKASVARMRGDAQMARHFERRVDSDRSRVYALFGEIAVLERELHGLEFKGAGAKVTTSATALAPDAIEQLRRDAQRVFEEERDALKRKYATDHSSDDD